MEVIDAKGAIITRFRTRKTALLLAYLALYRNRKHAREELIELFWPDLTPEAARDNLSGCLSSLRRQLDCGNTPIVLANRETVWMNPSITETDVATFESLLDIAAKEPRPAERRTILESAVALYRGPLLTGVYEEWVLGEQSRLEERFTLALIALAEAQRDTGALDTALSTALRAQQADPYNEASYQIQMQVLAAQGRIESARVVFREFEQYLKRQLGGQPSPVLSLLFQSLDQIASARIPSIEEETITVRPHAGFKHTALPENLARLWGRSKEIEHLVQLLTASEGPRLITITGLGGVGKTRLSIATAAQSARIDPALVPVWVPLADVRETNQVLPFLVRTLGDGGDAPNNERFETVCQMLSSLVAAGGNEKRVLLVLDNAEHLLPRPEPTSGNAQDNNQLSLIALLRLLLDRLPFLTLLVTSRRILGMHGEQEFPLKPLTEDPAAALFAERAGLVRPDFEQGNHENAVREIVRRVDGIPLALEMIAAWSRTLTPSQILTRLTTGTTETTGHALDLLVSRSQDIPERHRSIKQTLLWSLEMLPASARETFVILGVFQGGWTLEAAEAVVGGNALESLQLLAEHSLITTAPVYFQDFPRAKIGPRSTERFYFLEPVRELAVELMNEQNPTSFHSTHAAYFEKLISRVSEKVEKATDALSEYLAEENNCRAAVNWLIKEARSNTALAEPLVKTVKEFSAVLFASGGQRDVWEISHRVLTRVPGLTPTLRAGLLLEMLGSAWRLHRHEEIAGLLDAGEKEAEKAGDRILLAQFRARRANLYYSQGLVTEAVATAEQTMRDFPDVYAEGTEEHIWMLTNLGAFLNDTMDTGRTIAVLERAVALGKARNMYATVCVSLSNLIICHIRQGNTVAASTEAHDALHLAIKYGDTDQVIGVLFYMASIAVSKGDLDRAACLSAAAAALGKAEAARRGVPVSEYHRPLDYLLHNPDWRDSLSEEALQEAEVRGKAMTLEEAVAFALESAAQVN